MHGISGSGGIPEGQDFNPRKGSSARRNVPESTLPVLSLVLGDWQPPPPSALPTPLLGIH